MKANRHYYVYLHTNTLNGKMYVGITTRSLNVRWKDGKGYGDGYFGRAIQKYGWDNFAHEYWEVESEEAMKQCEKDMIAFFNTCNSEYGYNLTEGGDGTCGWVPSEETKRKISESHMGHSVSEETRLKLSKSNKGKDAPMKGKHLSEAQKQHLSEINSGENNPNFGLHRSDETKRKLSDANKGKTRTEEQKRNISNACKGRVPWNKGKTTSIEARRKQSEAKKGKKIKIVDGKRVWYTPESE